MKRALVWATLLALFFLLAPVIATARELTYIRLPWEDIHMDSTAPAIVQSDIKKLIACESQDRDIAIVDSNGKMSYGILMFQQSTWDDFSAQSGITGSPMNENDAIEMATWAIEHGYLGRWTCAHILHLVA